MFCFVLSCPESPVKMGTALAFLLRKRKAGKEKAEGAGRDGERKKDKEDGSDEEDDLFQSGQSSEKGKEKKKSRRDGRKGSRRSGKKLLLSKDGEEAEKNKESSDEIIDSD